MTQFKDQVVLITGASRGIGEAIAHQFAAEGAQVIVSSRSQEGVDAVAAAINEQGGKAAAITCHNGDRESREQLIAQTVEQFGRVDVMINNAAANP